MPEASEMKIFVLALVLAMLVPTTEIVARGRVPTPAPTPSGKVGRLIVQRAPNFGSDLSIRLSIDGKRAADIPRNQHYGGVLAAGRHVLTALALPNTQSRRPTSIEIGRASCRERVEGSGVAGTIIVKTESTD